MPPSAKLKAWDIYAKELGDLGFGHPLWIPEPSPESGEVQLGDVGYLSQGKFCFLFNCMRGADDPVNRKGVPESFEVFIPPDGPVEESAKTIRNHIMNPILLCGNARSLDVAANVALSADPLAHVEGAMSYEVKQKTGAYLALKRPAHQTSLHCTEAIFSYLRAHHIQWRNFAIQRRGRQIDSQRILFVSGFVKTSVWAVGAFRHESSSATLKIDAGAMFGGGPVSASAGGAMSLSNCSAPLSLHRNGPAERLPWNDDALHSDDQCIFLQYVHLKYRWSIPGFSWPNNIGFSVTPPPGYRVASSTVLLHDLTEFDDCNSISLDSHAQNEDVGVGDRYSIYVLENDSQVCLPDRSEGIEANDVDSSGYADESFPEGRSSREEHRVRLNMRGPVSDYADPSSNLSSLPISPTISHQQYGVHGPSESFDEEVQDFDAPTRPCPRDVLDSEVDNSDASGHQVALQVREEAIEVSDDHGSGDEDESEDDLDEVDEVALDYILAHSDCSCACASTEDLYLFRQAPHVQGDAPDRNSSGVHAA